MTVQLRQKIVMISLAYLSIVQYALILGILMYAMNRFDIVNQVILIFGIASIISIIFMRTYQQDDVPFVKIFTSFNKCSHTCNYRFCHRIIIVCLGGIN